MKHDTTIIERTDTPRLNGTATDVEHEIVSDGIPGHAEAKIGRKAAALLGLVIVAGLTAASVGLEATVARAVEVQTGDADGDGTRGGNRNRNHNRPREAGDSADGDRSSKGNRNRPHDTGENGEPTASDGR